MVNRELRRQLLEKLHSSKQALSQRASRLKRDHGPMSTDDAVYVIAHMRGIDLSEYLSPSAYDRIRALVPRVSVAPLPTPQQPRPRSAKKKQNVAGYPLVGDTLVKTAFDLGTEVFPLVFVLENAIRNLIAKRLSTVGTDWWDKCVPSDVQQNVRKTMEREKMYTYREQRGSHPLLYANFADLKKVIIDNSNRAKFADVIKDFDLFRAKMDEVYMARNNLAHSVRLSANDISRIRLFYGDWSRQLQAAGEA